MNAFHKIGAGGFVAVQWGLPPIADKTLHTMNKYQNSFRQAGCHDTLQWYNSLPGMCGTKGPRAIELIDTVLSLSS